MRVAEDGRLCAAAFVHLYMEMRFGGRLATAMLVVLCSEKDARSYWARLEVTFVGGGTLVIRVEHYC